MPIGHIHGAHMVTPHKLICACGHEEMRWYPENCVPCQQKRYSPYHTCPLYAYYWEQDRYVIAIGLRNDRS